MGNFVRILWLLAFLTTASSAQDTMTINYTLQNYSSKTFSVDDVDAAPQSCTTFRCGAADQYPVSTGAQWVDIRVDGQALADLLDVGKLSASFDLGPAKPVVKVDYNMNSGEMNSFSTMFLNYTDDTGPVVPWPVGEFIMIESLNVKLTYSHEESLADQPIITFTMYDIN